MTIATKNGLRGRCSRLLPLEQLEVRTLLSASGSGFEELIEEDVQALIAAPITATWVPQGPAPIQSAQVENITPNNQVSGAIHAIAAHPTNANILFVGATNGGIWRTKNATASSPTWEPLTDDMSSMSIGALEYDPTDPSNKTLVAGIGLFSSFGGAGGDRTGLLRTTDSGDTWTELDGGGTLIGNNISGVAARGATIVVSDNFSGVYRSTNTGATFSLVAGGSGLGSGRAFDLVGRPNNSSTLYTAVRGTGTNSGIYKSIDTGATWTKVSSTEIDDLIKSPGEGDFVTQNIELAAGTSNNVFAAIINDGQLAGVFRTGDGGATWTQMDLPLTNEDGGDVGTNPRVKPGELPGSQGQIHFSILADPGNSNIVYVGGDRQPQGFNDEGEWPNAIGANNFTGRLFRGDASKPEDSQWVHLTHSNSLGAAGGGTASNSAPHADSREMVFDANGNIIEGDDGGIYRRTNPRSNLGDWFSINGNLQVTEFHDIAYDHNSHVIIGGSQDNGTSGQNFPGSTVWTQGSGGDGGDVAVDDTSMPGFSIRYSSSQNLGNFVRTIFDANNNPVGGTAIALQELGANQIVLPFVTPVVLNEINPARMIIGGGNSTWESFDRGDTIAVVGAGISVNSSANPIAYGGRIGNSANPDVLYVGSNSNVFVRTSAGGALAPATEYPGDFVLDIELDASDWRTAYVIDSSDNVWVTHDAGESWGEITTDLDTVASGFRSLEFVPGMNEDSLVVGTGRGLFATQTSSLGTWAEVGNLPNVPIWDLDYDATDDVLVAGTLGRGAWALSTASEILNPFDLPDLVGDFFNITTDSALAGGVVDVEYRVSNADILSSGSYRVDFFLSADTTITTGDRFLSSQNLPGLNGGATTSTLLKSLQLPAATDSFWQGGGTFYIGMIIDRFDLTLESSETNNSNVGQQIDRDNLVVGIPDTQADLLGTSFNVLQEPLVSGDSFDLKFSVRNNSTFNAGPFNISFYLSRNGHISSSDVPLGQYTVNSLNGDSVHLNTIALELPQDESFYANANDEYFIGMIVDSGNVIAESNEVNNQNLGELFDRDTVMIFRSSTQVTPPLPDTLGVFNPSTHTFFLRNSNDSGVSDVAPFNLPDGANAIPVSGDWNGDGVDSVGVYNSDTGEFKLINENAGGVTVEIVFNFAIPGLLPIAGDWNTDGVDSVGVYDPSTSTFYLRASNAGGNVPVTTFNYGMPGWQPIVGDWDGNGTETVGLYNPATATFFLRNTNDTGMASIPAFNYGLPNWVPLAGDWNSDGIDTIGVYNAATATTFLRNSNNSGVADVPAFNYGVPNWMPVVGKWIDTVQPLLAADGVGSSSGASLTTGDIQAVLSEAAGKWATAGSDAAKRLLAADIRIADLPGAMLGSVVGDRVYLDIDAAGHGWFVDPTPHSDEEYELLATGLLAANSGPAAEGIDLLSVLEHEFGHMLGLADHDDDTADIMFESLAKGQRRTA